ncbi:hypothetical protein AB205_0019110 [Aquarana catesbeiana]|uniref:Uncharacterized protein n=1 Tax=Aquarana catesbeiana TaxID=8400 RepID=A0A2G9Q927_AQUCT|nr:hypothetical protein AB205_0019110 [Aquarana catesbeiana]
MLFQFDSYCNLHRLVYLSVVITNSNLPLQFFQSLKLLFGSQRLLCLTVSSSHFTYVEDTLMGSQFKETIQPLCADSNIHFGGGKRCRAIPISVLNSAER